MKFFSNLGTSVFVLFYSYVRLHNFNAEKGKTRFFYALFILKFLLKINHLPGKGYDLFSLRSLQTNVASL